MFIIELKAKSLPIRIINKGENGHRILMSRSTTKTSCYHCARLGFPAMLRDPCRNGEIRPHIHSVTVAYFYVIIQSIKLRSLSYNTINIAYTTILDPVITVSR